MSNLGQGGWISRVMSFQHEALATAGEAHTQKEVRKSEKSRTSKQRKHEAAIAGKTRQFRESELAAKMAVSRRRDILFKQIAIYSIISVGAMAVIITGGIFLIKGKKNGGK
jgi:hypothetical protein